MTPGKIKFKAEVEVGLEALSVERIRMLVEAVDTAPQLVGGVMVVTSANDGVHKSGSLHYEDRAFDIRFLGMREGGIVVIAGDMDATYRLQRRAAAEWGTRLQARLGDAYDVIVEADHIHVEEDRA